MINFLLGLIAGAIVTFMGLAFHATIRLVRRGALRDPRVKGAKVR